MDIILNNKIKTNSHIITSYKNSLKGSKGFKAEKFGSYFVSFILAAFCKENSLDFSTQATLKNHQRPDFIVWDWAVVFEILDSEKLKDLDKKHYPLPIIPLPVSIPLIELYEMLQELKNTRGQTITYYQKKMCKLVAQHQKNKIRGYLSLNQWLRLSGVKNGY